MYPFHSVPFLFCCLISYRISLASKRIHAYSYLMPRVGFSPEVLLLIHMKLLFSSLHSMISIALEFTRPGKYEMTISKNNNGIGKYNRMQPISWDKNVMLRCVHILRSLSISLLLSWNVGQALDHDSLHFPIISTMIHFFRLPIHIKSPHFTSESDQLQSSSSSRLIPPYLFLAWKMGVSFPILQPMIMISTYSCKNPLSLAIKTL